MSMIGIECLFLHLIYFMIMTRIVLFSKKIVQISLKLASEKPKNQENISGEKNLT